MWNFSRILALCASSPSRCRSTWLVCWLSDFPSQLEPDKGGCRQPLHSINPPSWLSCSVQVINQSWISKSPGRPGHFLWTLALWSTLILFGASERISSSALPFSMRVICSLIIQPFPTCAHNRAITTGTSWSRSRAGEQHNDNHNQWNSPHKPICAKTARPGLDHLGAGTTQSDNDLFTCFKIYLKKQTSKQIFKIHVSWILTEQALSYRTVPKSTKDAYIPCF